MKAIVRTFETEIHVAKEQAPRKATVTVTLPVDPSELTPDCEDYEIAHWCHVCLNEVGIVADLMHSAERLKGSRWPYRLPKTEIVEVPKP